MKTAISIPDSVFEAADALAERLGISRSELYSNAVKALVEEHRDKGVTERLNRFFSEHPAELDPVLTLMQEATLRMVEW